MVELDIDGRTVQVKEGSTIIEAADGVGIYIPRFCYHKKLSIAANCRMCLVEVEKSPKALPACATPVTSGMKVNTASKKTILAQQSVMEYLLINHPLDCPICDQGGECELQDLAMGFGRSYSHYDQSKRAVLNPNLGPLIKTDMTRCIQCTRCVRFGEEIAGLRELGVLHRGEKEEIATYVQHVMRSELSGNIIDLCPVGALTDKPACYQGRAWEYREHPFISPHDCVGTHVFIHSRGQEYAPQRMVMRTVAREHEAINETWISDRDRYSHFGLSDESRLFEPKLKKHDRWETISWESALAEVIKIGDGVKKGSWQAAALAGSNATLEEYYLFQKLCRTLGIANLDHRVRWQDFSDQNAMPLYPSMAGSIADIEQCSVILLIGSDIRSEQPLLASRIYQAFLKGTRVLVVNAMDYSFVFDVETKWVVPLRDLAHTVCVLMQGDSPEEASSVNPRFSPDNAEKLLEAFGGSGKKLIILGEQALHHPESSRIRSAVYTMAEQHGVQVALLTEGANSAGAWLAGVLPHRGPMGEKLREEGLSALDMLLQPQDVYFLFNLEPEFDCAASMNAISTFEKAKRVVCFTSFVTEKMYHYAHVLLPLAPFTETDGTFINVEGKWQSFLPVSVPSGEAKAGWKILRALGQHFKKKDFIYPDIDSVRAEVRNQLEKSKPLSLLDKYQLFSSIVSKSPECLREELFRLAPWPMYRVDPLVRRSAPLQAQMASDWRGVCINSKTADRLQLQSGEEVVVIQNGQRLKLTLSVDDRLADDTVLLPSAMQQTAGFGCASAPIQLERQ